MVRLAQELSKNEKQNTESGIFSEGNVQRMAA